MRREIGAGLALGEHPRRDRIPAHHDLVGFSTIYGEHWLLVAMTVVAGAGRRRVVGDAVGSLLPFLLRRLGFDPAVSSAPFVATLVDVTGLIIYFSVGLVVLRGTLL